MGPWEVAFPGVPFQVVSYFSKETSKRLESLPYLGKRAKLMKEIEKSNPGGSVDLLRLVPIEESESEWMAKGERTRGEMGKDLGYHE
jgi:hypothetical protein